MSKVKGNLSSRLLAAFLSVVMVFGMIPFTAFTAFAATTEHSDAVTISVVDEEGTAVQGATVDFTINSVANGENYITGTETTDAYGCVEIMASSAFVADDLTVSASITKTDYTEESITNESITSEDQDFAVTLTSTVIKDVTVTANSGLVYDGQPKSLVTITGTQPDDTITYTVDDEVAENAEKTDAGTYKVEVTVKREGYTDLVKTFSAVTIAKANIEDIDIAAVTVPYSESGDQDIVKLTGSFKEDDVVEWSVGGDITGSRDIPQESAIGNYSVKLTVKRGNNYNDFVKTVESEIQLANIELGSLSITANQLTYDGTDQKALTVKDQGNYNLEYSFTGTSGWTTFTDGDNYPTVNAAGNYTIYVKATKANYNDKDYPTYPINVTVSKAGQKLEFVNTNSATITLDKDTPANNIKDFSATPDDISELNSNSVEYSLINKSNDNVASIDENTGIVTFANAGIVTVKAYREGNENYADAELYFTVTVNVANDGLVFFETQTATYTYDEDGVVSEQTAKKLYDGTDGKTADNGTLTYSMTQTDKDKGLSIDSATGKVTISNRAKLIKALKSTGSTTITVKVNKAEGTVTTQEEYISGYFLLIFPIYSTRDITQVIYPSATASYDIIISYGSTISFDEVCEITDPSNTGWYNSENKPVISVKDNAKYSIAIDSTEKSDFGSSKEITTQGENTFYVYIKDLTAQKKTIFAPVPITIKVDTVKPDTSKMKISYSSSIADKLISFVTFGYYNPSVVVTFEATDETAGVDFLNWKYVKEQNESVANLAEDSGTLTFDASGKATLTITASELKQYRGNLSFTVTDKAGNVSDEKKDNDHVIVVDTVAPSCVVTYADPLNTISGTSNVKRYFNGSVELTFTITETNFYKEDIIVKVSKNGAAPTTVTPAWSKSLETDNVYIGKYTLSGDGNYVVSAQYKDRSNNTMTNYESDVIVIDTIDPEISLAYSKDGQKTTFTVKEHNFRPDDVTVTVGVKDVNNNVITANDLNNELRTANWTPKGNDTYTYETSNYVNGIYNIKFDYKDLANRTDSFTAEEFIIDHAKPSNPEITYSTSLKDTILDVITLGFYNPTVTVTFTSYDDFSGVDYFTWSYTRQANVSETNIAAYADAKLNATQDNTDKSKYTASIDLPLNTAEQLRGYVAATATDTYANTSDKTTDTGKIIVVDTVSPTMTVEYSEESNKVGTTLYYGITKEGKAEVTFKITEANFFKEDVVVKVAKNGGTAEQVTPIWTDVDADNHIGKYTISGDGHYVVSVDYTDRSNNTMTSYTSDMITIDTIVPVIDVVYQNTDKIGTFEDKDGNQRDYFDKTQTAIVTITEHNFDANDVKFNIIGKDVTGAGLDVDSLISKSAWSDNGDVHKITITYSGDANYYFDVDYTDLATNKADDYAEDHFTVDTVAPNVTNVEYSTSVLETVLESISFGFYNAKMTVTITADDATAGVHKFDYSYLTAVGVSSVNAQLLDQAIEEANITYSNGGKTATMSFEIPKMVLGNDNQFNGTVKFDAIDRSNNKTEQSETKRVVVDNIAPNATVAYNTPVNEVNGISYYDGNITGTITITEANFYSDDVVVMVSKDGAAAQKLSTTWNDSSVDVHVGTFTLTDDADYVVTVSYKDKSGNAMTDYKSNQLTIDTKIEEPTYSINGKAQSGDNGGAYKDDASITFNFADQNYDTNTVKLTRTRFDKVEDVTNDFIKTSLNDKGGSGTFTIPKEVNNDGIYLLTVSMTDKAKHSTESHVKFTVNRFGSVYEYNDYLCDLIKDGGQYIKLDASAKAAITKDLVITEYNADKLVADSLKILITRDGEPVDVIYTSNPEKINENVTIGSDGWYEYIYTISKDNFKEDGVYKITISSKDATGNESTSVPDNSINNAGEKILDTMTFTVDTTAPEIRNIINLDKEIASKDAIIDGKLNVKYTLVDVGGLAKVEVYLNGEVIDTITKFDNNNNFTGAFDISESNDIQTVRLVVTDLAGNVTDTDSDKFDPGELYTFNNAITVSTNFFVRWYRNTPLFWGSIGGVVVIAGAIWLIIAKKKKKSETK